MSNKINFTQERIRRLLAPSNGRIDYHDSGCPKLTCRVSHTGNKSFVVLKKNAAGKVQRITIGRFPDLSVAKARELTRNALSELSSGIDPIEKKRKQKRQSITLNELLNLYLDQKDLRVSTKTDYRKKLNQGFSDWHDKPVSSITREMILTKHKKLSTSSPTTRDNKIRVLRLLMTYAVATKIIKDNPVDVLKEIKLWSKPERKNRIIPSDKLHVWYKTVLELNNPKARCYFLLLLYTGLRAGEAQGLKWADVDMERKCLIVRDTKNHTDFKTYIANPLMPYMRELQVMTGNQEFVFSGNGRFGYMDIPRKHVISICKKTGIEFSSHDLRRTFATIAEAVHISETLIKRLLNHTTDNDVTIGYIRTEEDTIRKSIESVASYIQNKTAHDVDNVVSIQNFHSII